MFIAQGDEIGQEYNYGQDAKKDNLLEVKKVDAQKGETYNMENTEHYFVNLSQVEREKTWLSEGEWNARLVDDKILVKKEERQMVYQGLIISKMASLKTGEAEKDGLRTFLNLITNNPTLEAAKIELLNHLYLVKDEYVPGLIKQFNENHKIVIQEEDEKKKEPYKVITHQAYGREQELTDAEKSVGLANKKFDGTWWGKEGHKEGMKNVLTAKTNKGKVEGGSGNIVTLHKKEGIVDTYIKQYDIPNNEVRFDERELLHSAEKVVLDNAAMAYRNDEKRIPKEYRGKLMELHVKLARYKLLPENIKEVVAKGELDKFATEGVTSEHVKIYQNFVDAAYDLAELRQHAWDGLYSEGKAGYEIIDEGYGYFPQSNPPQLAEGQIKDPEDKGEKEEVEEKKEEVKKEEVKKEEVKEEEVKEEEVKEEENNNKVIDPLDEVKNEKKDKIFSRIQALHKTSYDKKRLLAKTKEIISDHMKDAGSTRKDLKHAAILFDAKKDSDASKLVEDISALPTLEHAVEAIKKHIAINTRVHSATKYATDQQHSILRNRMAGSSSDDDNSIAVASGNENYLENPKAGVWFMPIYGQANQKKEGDSLGYKVKSGGGIVGVDTKLNDDQTMIGAAFSVINSDIKYKTQYKDKTKADSLIFSLYAKQNIKDGLFIQALASYSSTKVHHQEERIFSFGNEIAKSKYTSRAYGGEILLGYDAKLCKELTLTPFAGISYLKFRDGRFKETGLSFANRTVEANRSDRTDGIVGARLSTMINTDNGMQITPEVHGVYTRKIQGKAGKIVAKIDGMNEPFTDIPKKVKTIGNIGASLTAKSGMFEYGAGYDLQLAKKYLGHQGTLKLRINM